MSLSFTCATVSQGCKPCERKALYQDDGDYNTRIPLDLQDASRTTCNWLYETIECVFMPSKTEITPGQDPRIAEIKNAGALHHVLIVAEPVEVTARKFNAAEVKAEFVFSAAQTAFEMLGVETVTIHIDHQGIATSLSIIAEGSKNSSGPKILVSTNNSRETTVHATRQLVASVVSPNEVTEDTLNSFHPQNNPDFVILAGQPAGEPNVIRFRGTLGWTTTYSEFGRTEKSFFDLKADDFLAITAEQFRPGNRRFGGLNGGKSR